MKRLYDALISFNGRECKAEKDLIEEFRKIAEIVLGGGYFLVNDKVKIYPTDIEFYFHSDRAETEQWKKDFCVYHRGEKDKVPYFPIGSLHPHKSGVDISFENEEQEYRASFLIRGHKYVDGKEIYETNKPTELREDLFGYADCLNGGLKLKWKDIPEAISLEITNLSRINVSKYDINGVPIPKEKDDRKWRFKIK